MFASLLLAAAQQVFLDEDFSGGVFPPAGWGEVLYAAEPGWTAGAQSAFHDNYTALSDSVLFTSAMDLSGASAAYLHLDYGQRYPLSRQINAVEYSLDGGITTHPLYEIQILESGSGLRLELDLSALTGLNNVRLAFRYYGYRANEWWLERVRVDDQPATGPGPWPELPTQFLPIRSLRLSFDNLAGVQPAWMAINELDAETRVPTQEAWTNIGQRAPTQEAYEGSYALEMAGAPGRKGTSTVANAMILGIDGTGFDQVDLTFWAKQLGEEVHPDDGVFLSVDGVTWFPLVLDWGRLSKGSVGWFFVGVPLESTPVPIDGRFYLAFAEADDAPFGTTDGVIIDDIQLRERRATWTYEVQNLKGGEFCRLDVTGITRPNSYVQLLYSLTGAGPTFTPFGYADLGAPILDLGAYSPDAQGNIRVPRFVPAVASGATIWTQALEIAGFGTDGWWSPMIEAVVL